MKKCEAFWNGESRETLPRAALERARPIEPVVEPASEKPDSSDRTRTSQTDLIVELVDALGIELVHDLSMLPYALVKQTSVRAVYAVRSTAFRSVLAKEFFERYGKSPRTAALADARTVLEGRAQHAGRLVDVALRIAGGEDVIDVDLGDDRWRMVHITRDGWSVMPHGDRIFRRAPGMLALPDPVRGGSLAELREFIRVDDDNFALIAAFLVNALRHRGPYPILPLTGEQGSAKTTTARTLRRLVDPNRADVRAEPRDNRDLMIAANNGHMIALDNLSHLSTQLSDALCRLSTGGGFATRTLYSDDEETIFYGQRPLILTSIADVASRPDLLDRCLSVRLQPIPECERRTEEELWTLFEVARPRLFGALLDAVSAALRNVRETDRAIKSKPRMADAYCWALAAAPALGIDAGATASAWSRTLDEAHTSILESSLIFAPLRTLVENAGGWSGSATELLAAIASLLDESITRRRDWPRNAKGLANQVRSIAPALRRVGIDHYEPPRKSGARLHVFASRAREVRENASLASYPSSGSRDLGKTGDSLASSRRHLSQPAGASVIQRRHNDEACDLDDANDDGLCRLSASDDVEFIR